MSEVQEVRARLRAGEITATEAGAEIGRAMTLDDGVPDGVTPTETTQTRMARSLAERNDHHTFLEVTSAWIGGDLTDEDLWTICSAATGTRKGLG